LVWYARRIRLDETAAMQARRRRAGGRGLVMTFAALGFAQILVGALVAGIDAGRTYVDWPLMSGQFLPPDPFAFEPVWRNFFENPSLVQFVHRMLGYLVALVGLVVAVVLLRRRERQIRWHGLALGLAVLAQTALGIVTVIHASPLEIAIWHQAGAVVLTGITVSALFVLAYPPATKITA
ncbi:MAG: COX15/CtaA family protein, partial [Pseudomonadota bacterium]